jgi:hypothetical protein
MEIENWTHIWIEKYKYLNHVDKAFGPIFMSISSKLLFHVESSTTPNEVWTTLEGIFRKHDVMHDHFINIELK